MGTIECSTFVIATKIRKRTVRVNHRNIWFWRAVEGSHQPLFDGFYHRFGFGVDGEFAVDVVDMSTYRADGDAAVIGNHFVAVAGYKPLQHIVFTRRKGIGVRYFVAG